MSKRRAPVQDEAYWKQRAYRLERGYGITLEEYDAIKQMQDGTCALCRRAKGISAPLQVDHDHAGEGREFVRGLLCGRCNNRLGWFEAKRDRVLAYLDNPPAKGVLK